LFRCAPFIGTPTLARLTLGCALFFGCLPALVGTLLFSHCASSFLFNGSTLLVHARAFLRLLLRPCSLLRRPCLFLGLSLLCGPGGLFLCLAPLLRRALLQLALLGGSCRLLLCSTLLLHRPLLRRLLLFCCPTSLRLICTCRRRGRWLRRPGGGALLRWRRSPGRRRTGALRSRTGPRGWSTSSATLFAVLRTLRCNKRRRSQ
jgi:hypothetical protein